jgi:hypothetical protein
MEQWIAAINAVKADLKTSGQPSLSVYPSPTN